MHKHFVKDLRKGVFCIICFGIIAPVLFGIGLWMLLTSPFETTRATNVQQLNQVIASWNGKYQKEFQNQGFSIFSYNQSRFLPFNVDHTSDFTLASDINSYTPLKYVRTGGIESPQQYYDNLTVVLNITGLGAVNVTFFKSNQTADSPTVCQNNNGEYDDNGVCHYFWVISEVCLKISGNNNSWKLDNSYGGTGCYYSDGFSPESYSELPWTGGQFFNQYVDFSKLKITLRSSHDPFIFAQFISNGSLNFGLTPGQQALIGIILLSIGGFCFIPCIFCFIFVVTCFFRNRHLHTYERL